MKQTCKWILNGLLFLSLIASVILLAFSLGFKRDSPTVKSVAYIQEAAVSVDGGPWQQISLPHTCRDLAPGTPVTLKTVICPKEYDGVFVQTQYSEADVYLDGKLTFTFGKKENYPKFMLNPATEIHVIETYGTGEEMQVQIEYRAPSTGDKLTLEPLMVGSAKELILERMIRYGPACLLSLVQIVGGVALMLISIGLLVIDRKGILFFWLGLFDVCTGLWSFGSNQFAITIFPNTTWLYIARFLGVSASIVPLLQFMSLAVDFTEPGPLHILDGIFCAGVLLEVVLQLFGVFPLHRSCVFFRFTVPAALLFLTGDLLWECIHWKNKNAGRFLLPAAILALSSVVGMVQGNTEGPISVFQVGTILYLLIMGLIAGMSVKDSINLKKREEQLIHEKNILEIQTEEQRENSLLMAKNEQELSRQRHDLRHHLAAIQELSRDNKPLQEYLATLMERIPKAKTRFCENDVINAVISHYAARCEKDHVRFTVRLVVPDTGNQSVDSNLCVIFANLLENATEACERMTEGEQYIELNSTLKNKMLTVTMNNSFNGEVTQIGDRFRSAKRNDFGIGLASVKSIAEEARGGADFRAEGKVFLSSVYLHLS